MDLRLEGDVMRERQSGREKESKKSYFAKFIIQLKLKRKQKVLFLVKPKK